jgi:hypothetical protein
MELRKAAEVFKALKRHRESGLSGWVWYSPGDATKYRVHLIQATPVHVTPVEVAKVYQALLVQVIDTDETNPKSLLITEPSEWNKFTPDMWLDLGFLPGWWPGIRPLLAVLGWTDDEFSLPEFNRRDADDIGYALRVRDRQRARLTRV